MLAALIIGFSKTGVPGVGILAIPLIAVLFNGRASLGATLPLLMTADIIAVAAYRRHAQWETLGRLAPSVLVGFAVGITAFLLLDERQSARDTIGVVIGWAVLIMVIAQLARMRLGDVLSPTTPVATAVAGGLGGFATMMSNAAGPIMQIYMTGLKLDKLVFMGTSAWFFLIFNAIKIPIYVALGMVAPDRPFFTPSGLAFCALLAPVVVGGAFLGRWALTRVPQRAFTLIVLGLSAAAAIRLIATG